MSKVFKVTDDYGITCEYTAEEPEDAARQYVLTGDWPLETVYGDRPTKWELKVWESSQDEDDHEWVTIETTPEELPGGTREQHYPEEVTGKPASWD